MIATSPSGRSASSRRDDSVASGILASSGRSTMGARVPSKSSSSDQRPARSRSRATSSRCSRRGSVSGGVRPWGSAGRFHQTASGTSSRRRAERIFPAHRYTLLAATAARIRCIRRCRSSRGISRADRMASAISSMANGIDLQRVGQLAGRAGELAEDQHAVLVGPAGDELLGDQVHPVVQRADDAEVGQPVQGHHLDRPEVLLAVDDGRPSRRYPTCQLIRSTSPSISSSSCW